MRAFQRTKCYCLCFWTDFQRKTIAKVNCCNRHSLWLVVSSKSAQSIANCCSSHTSETFFVRFTGQAKGRTNFAPFASWWFDDIGIFITKIALLIVWFVDWIASASFINLNVGNTPDRTEKETGEDQGELPFNIFAVFDFDRISLTDNLLALASHLGLLGLHIDSACVANFEGLKVLIVTR